MKEETMTVSSFLRAVAQMQNAGASKQSTRAFWDMGCHFLGADNIKAHIVNLGVEELFRGLL